MRIGIRDAVYKSVKIVLTIIKQKKEHWRISTEQLFMRTMIEELFRRNI